MVETLIALVLGTIGATMRSPELKEITWKREMKRRYVETASCNVVLASDVIINRPLNEIDPRMSFTRFAERAGILSAPSTLKS